LAAAGLVAVALAAAQNPAGLATPAPRRQDPGPPFPYDEVEAIVSSADGTRLEGTLTLPRGEGPFPAALLLSGAGAQDRDYSALGHRFFLVLADYLTRQGIAVLRLDDRGSALLLMIRRRVQEEPNLERASADILDGLDAWAGTLPPGEARIMRALSTRGPFRAQLQQLVAALGTPWNRSLFRLDPEPPLAALRIPVIALYGDLDRQAPSGDNAPVLQRLWAAHSDATVRVLPGLNHFLQHARSGLPAEIPDIDETMAPEALDTIADWGR
jgi:dienelactone hydrolase